jgi:hypothetical protein
MRFMPISVTSLCTLATTLESYDSDKILTLSFKSFGIHICGQHMHFSVSLMGRVVHVSLHSSLIPNVIPWKKIMVKFGFFEMQLGFKSCTGYLCKGKRKRNVNKIHQISFEYSLIVDKIKEMQDSSSV